MVDESTDESLDAVIDVPRAVADEGTGVEVDGVDASLDEVFDAQDIRKVQVLEARNFRLEMWAGGHCSVDKSESKLTECLWVDYFERRC